MCVCAYAREVEGAQRVVVHGFDALALEDLDRHGRLEGVGRIVSVNIAEAFAVMFMCKTKGRL